LQISENKANKELIAVLEKKIEDLRKEKTSLKSELEEQASTKNNQIKSMIFKKDQAEKKIVL